MNEPLPEGWAWATLEDVADWGSGGTPKKTEHQYYGGDIPWAVIGDLNDDVVTYCRDSITSRGLAESSCKLVEPGTVLIAMYGSIGKLGVTGIPMATNQAIAFARPNIQKWFLFYYLLSQRTLLSTAGKGATQRNISQTVLRKWPIPIAPLVEQDRIVEQIKDIFLVVSTIDTKLRSLLDKLALLREVILTNAFHVNTDTSLPWTTIGELCDINPRFSKTSFSDEQILTFIPMSAVEAETCFVDVSESRTMGELRHGSYRGFRDGDILVAKITPSMENGKVAVAQGLVDGWGMGSTEFHILRPHLEVEPRYIAWFTLQKSFRAEARMKMTGTAGQLRVPAGFLKTAPIPFPSLDDQRSTVRQIDNNLGQVNTVERSIQSLIDRIEMLRRSVLTEAFAGRLVPQDPDDEPASVLLERIAASHPSKPKRRRKARA